MFLRLAPLTPQLSIHTTQRRIKWQQHYQLIEAVIERLAEEADNPFNGAAGDSTDLDIPF